MMWIIASVPFWALGILGGVTGSAALIYGLFSVKVDQEEFNKIASPAIIVALGGGLLMIFAAHLCS